MFRRPEILGQRDKLVQNKAKMRTVIINKDEQDDVDRTDRTIQDLLKCNLSN